MTSKRSLLKDRLILIGIALLTVVLISGAAWAIFGDRAASQTTEPSAEPMPSIIEGQNPFDDANPSEYAVDVSNVDRTNREAVAKKFVEISTTWYPGTDYNETKAILRASGLMSPDLADKIAGPDRPTTDEPWRVWGERNGWSIPSVKVREPLHGAESDDETNEFVNTEVPVVWRWIAEGYNSEYSDEQRIYYLAMTDNPERGWEVADYTVDFMEWATQN
ncbi:hypothetical protein [Glutamicibacter arilaitensis]|uniref:hypothetical protein n=1 Tax=Glutamicibacter TaxID=1742989 RepID=UPI003F91634B